MEMEKQKRRHFGGVLYVPPDRGREHSPQNRFDKNLQERHLKSYLRGDQKFYYKGHWFPVLETWR